jgi:hypothetical protein
MGCDNPLSPFRRKVVKDLPVGVGAGAKKARRGEAADFQPAMNENRDLEREGALPAPELLASIIVSDDMHHRQKRRHARKGKETPASFGSGRPERP